MKMFLKWWLIYFLLGCIFLLPLGYYFWPGKFASDTFTQMDQALGFNTITDNHPVLTILIMKLFLLIGENFYHVFYYLAFQLLFISIFTSFSVTVLVLVFFNNIKYQYKFLLGLLLMFIFCVAPPSGIFHVTLLKDNFSTWLLVTFAVLITSFYHTVFSKNPNLKLFFGISVIGGLGLFFRHNSYTLIGPLIAITSLIYYINGNKKSVMILKNIAIYFLIFFSIYTGKILMVNHYIKSDTSFWNSFNLKEWVLQNDFLMALKKDLPIITTENKLKLEKIINIEKTKERSSLENSFFQLEFIDANNKRTVYSKDLMIFAEHALYSHPFQWLKIKLLYTKELISSKHSYKLPSPGFEDFGLNDKYHLNINMNKNTQSIREEFRKISGLDNGFFITRLGIWNFWPIVIFQIFILLSIISYIILTLFNRKIHSIFKEKSIFPIVLITPIISSMLLSFPLIIGSTTNDYRYFWPCNIFTIILILILINYIFKFKKIQYTK